MRDSERLVFVLSHPLSSSPAPWVPVRVSLGEAASSRESPPLSYWPRWSPRQHSARGGTAGGGPKGAIVMREERGPGLVSRCGVGGTCRGRSLEDTWELAGSGD